MELISLDELEVEWRLNGMPRKRAAGVFIEIIAHRTSHIAHRTSHIAHRTRARDPRWLSGESCIVKLLTMGGQHVGTVHEIRMPDGSTPHSHPKDYTRRDCSRAVARALE